MADKKYMIPDLRFENLESLISKVEDISAYCGQWQRDVMLEPAAIKSLRRMIIASSAGASTRIEGAVLNNSQVLEVILKKKRLFEERSAGDVLGYSEALNHIFAYKSSGRTVLSQQFIKKLHSITMKFSVESLQGRYRYTEVNVSDGQGGVLLFCVLPDLIPKFMTNAVDRLNKDWNNPKKSKLIIITEFIAEFLAIHPFEDGNGRCARLLMVLLLRLAGHDYFEYTSLEEQIEKQKGHYYLTLNKVQKTGVMDGWFAFCLDTLRLSQLKLQSMIKKGADSTKSPVSLTREIREAFRNRNKFTAGELVDLTGKSPAGVRKALNELVKKKELKAYGSNRGRYYILN